MSRHKSTLNAETELSNDIQLDLFEIIESGTVVDRQSNIIHIYDALPKYNWDTREHRDLSEARFSRPYKLGGVEYIVSVRPAIIDRVPGTSVLVYPGTREELVEDALRKLAVSGQWQLMENGAGVNAGVTFTLYQLQQELKRMGKHFDLTSIKEAIMVCRGATLECYTVGPGGGETIINSSFFTMVGLTTRGEYLKRGGDAKCYVAFNPLVTRSIIDLTYRRFSYKTSMDMRSALGRFLYKRMSQNYVQASIDMPYSFKLVSFLTESPRGLSPRMPENIRAMRKALDDLVANEVLRGYDEDRTKLKQKVIDIKYILRPHEKFISQVINANRLKKSMVEINEQRKFEKLTKSK